MPRHKVEKGDFFKQPLGPDAVGMPKTPTRRARDRYIDGISRMAEAR
jgi:hypothetical protein